MRVGEAIGLDRDDVDLAHEVLVVRDSKFGKSREVPFHPTAARALADYARLRDATFRRPRSPAFLLSLAGTRLIYNNAPFMPWFRRSDSHLDRRVAARGFTIFATRSPSAR